MQSDMGVWCGPMGRVLENDFKELDEDYENLSLGQRLMADRLLVRFEDQVQQVVVTDQFVTRCKLKKLVAVILS